MQESNLKYHLQLHFIVFLWGFSAILGALITIDAIPLVWFRMTLAVFFIALYFLYKRQSITIPKKTLLKFLGTGILIALHWITFFHAIKVSTISVALVTMSTGAFFTSFIEPFFFKRKIKPVEIVLGLIVVVGLYIIFNFEAQYTMGIVFALISTFLSSLFSVLNGLYVKTEKPTVISLYQLFFGALFITGYLAITGQFSATFFNLPALDWLWLLILSLVCTSFAFIVSVNIMKKLTPYTLVLTLNLEPVYAIIFALWIFGEKEQMNMEFYIGAAIIFGVVILNAVLKKAASLRKNYVSKKPLKK